MTPELTQYSPKFQARAADELEAIDLPPCARLQEDGDLSGCSAIKVLIPDYLSLRNDIRALKGKQE